MNNNSKVALNKEADRIITYTPLEWTY